MAPKLSKKSKADELQEGVIGLRNFATTVKADALVVDGQAVALTKDDAWAIVDGFSSLIGKKELDAGQTRWVVQDHDKRRREHLRPQPAAPAPTPARDGGAQQPATPNTQPAGAPAAADPKDRFKWLKDVFVDTEKKEEPLLWLCLSASDSEQEALALLRKRVGFEGHSAATLTKAQLDEFLAEGRRVNEKRKEPTPKQEPKEKGGADTSELEARIEELEAQLAVSQAGQSAGFSVTYEKNGDGEVGIVWLFGSPNREETKALAELFNEEVEEVERQYDDEDETVKVPRRSTSFQSGYGASAIGGSVDEKVIRLQVDHSWLPEAVRAAGGIAESEIKVVSFKRAVAQDEGGFPHMTDYSYEYKSGLWHARPVKRALGSGGQPCPVVHVGARGCLGAAAAWALSASRKVCFQLVKERKAEMGRRSSPRGAKRPKTTG